MREFRVPIQMVYERLRRGESLTAEDGRSITQHMAEYTEAQRGALATQLVLRTSRSDPEDQLLQTILLQSDAIRHYLTAISGEPSK